MNNKALIALTRSLKVNKKRLFQKRQQSGLPTSDNLIISYNDKADKVEEKLAMVKGSKIVLNIIEPYFS